MALFGGLFSRPTAPAPVVFQVPVMLPKLSAGASPEAPAGPLAGLLRQQKPVEAVSFLAHALPERDAVRWAAQSCEMVSGQQSAEDQRAAETSRRWLAQPNEANRQEAGAAAAAAAHAGPGAWSAQAAAWSAPSFGTGNASPEPVPSGLVGQAVTGSVMLAAAMSHPGFKLPSPATQTAPARAATLVATSTPAPPPGANRELCLLYKPFIDRGIALATGA